MSWIMDAIKDNLIEIVIYGFMFLAGFGMGGAVTAMIWGMKEDEEKTIYTHYGNPAENDKVRKDSKNREACGKVEYQDRGRKWHR